MQEKSCVYFIINKVNRKCYIGGTKDIITHYYKGGY